MPVTYKQISAVEYTAQLVDDGWARADAQHIAEMFVMMERGLLAEPADGVTQVLGRPARTFEDYVVRAAAAGAWHR